MKLQDHILYDCYCKGMSPEDACQRVFQFIEWSALVTDTAEQWHKEQRELKRKQKLKVKVSNKRRSPKGVEPMNIIEYVKCWQTRKGGAVVVVLPKSIREKLDIKPNTQFLITYDKQGRLILTKVD